MKALCMALLLAQAPDAATRAPYVDGLLKSFNRQNELHNAGRNTLPNGGNDHSLYEKSPEESFAELFDARSLAVVREATRLEVIRLKSSREMKGYLTQAAKKGEPAVDGYAIDYRVNRAPPEVLEKARAVALSPRSYLITGGNKLCGGFQPKVALRFWREKPRAESVDILLCFNCEDVEVIKAPSLKGSDETTPLADMNQASSSWLAVAKAALPNDKQIQGFQAEEPFQR